MLVTITPTVTAGVNRGGEDLELEVTALYCAADPPSQMGKLEWEFTDHGYTHEEKDDDVVRVESDHYDFEWEGKIEDVLDLKCGWPEATVREKLLDPQSWTFCHKPGEKPRLSFSERVYIEGNAD